MNMEPIFDPETEQDSMDIVGFFSGGASSLIAVLEKQEEYRRAFKADDISRMPYEVVLAFTDNSEASGIKKVAKYGVPVIVNDLESYHVDVGIPGIRDPKKRRAMDKKIVREIRECFDSDNESMIDAVLETFDRCPDYALLSGSMWYLTDSILDLFRTIQNVHPADLNIRKSDGRRTFTGDYAVPDAILAGQSYTKSSIHIVTEGIDEGPLVVQSKKMMVEPVITKLVSEITTKYERRKTVTAMLREIENKDKFRLDAVDVSVDNDLFNSFRDNLGVSNEDVRRIIRVMAYAEKHQDRMKAECDVPAFIKAVELTASGRVALSNGEVYIKEGDMWWHRPEGFQLEATL